MMMMMTHYDDDALLHPAAGCPCPWASLTSLTHLDLHIPRLPSHAALLGLAQLKSLHSLLLQVASCGTSSVPFTAASVLAAVQGLQGLRTLLVQGHVAVSDRWAWQWYIIIYLFISYICPAKKPV
jgi:hypothetical protein